MHSPTASLRPEVAPPSGSEQNARRRVSSPRWLALLLIGASVVGLVAATALTMDKLALLRNPAAALSCNISPLVGCGKGLDSWQGALLQFPNSIVGMACWSALFMAALGLFVGIELPRLAWVGLNVGLAGAVTLVIFLVGQSIYVLGILCPWCMITWMVTIPAFLAVTLFNLSTWPHNYRVRERGRAVLQWLPLITLACFAVIAVLAQLRLNVLGSL